MIRVRLPATTANLGPGFDCMGLALDLWNTFELKLGGDLVGSGAKVEVHGEGATQLATDGSNLIAAILRDELGPAAPRDFKITCYNEIPIASGLGSSSTGVLAGLIFAEACRKQAAGTDPSEIDIQAVLDRAVALEGHGDNVAPALLGGFVIVVPDAKGVLTQRIPHVPMKTVVCVPEFNYLTTTARAALPATYSKEDAIFNIGRAMLVAEALRAGDDTLLANAMNDRIHEPYRLQAIPGAVDAKAAAAREGAICVALSGAGPGVISFSRGRHDRIGRAMKDAFARHGLKARYWILDATSEGAKIGRLPL